MKSMLTASLAGLGVLTVAFGASAQGASDAYTLLELQRIDPARPVYPTALNNSGIAVGCSVDGPSRVPVVFMPDGEPRAFLLIPREVCAGDVNCDGKVTPTDFAAWINAFNCGCD